MTGGTGLPAGVSVDGPQGAPVLVLGSSLGTTREMWRPQLDALAERYRVIRYDHPGHGAAPPAPDGCRIDDLGRYVLALLDELGVRRAHHAGLSLGGMVAMWIAAHAPERVDRLALLCTSARLGPAELWRDRAAAVRSGGTAAVAGGVVARWFTPEFAARRPDVVAGYRRMLVGTPATGYATCCGVIEAMDLRPALPRIRAATLVIAGADDPATPVDHARTIAGAVPGARLATVPGAAHLASVERPDEVTALLLRHLRDGEEPAHDGQ